MAGNKDATINIQSPTYFAMYVSYLVTMRAMEDSIIIRIASINDAETIRNIYNHEVLNSTASFDLVERSVEEQHILSLIHI